MHSAIGNGVGFVGSGGAVGAFPVSMDFTAEVAIVGWILVGVLVAAAAVVFFRRARATKPALRLRAPRARHWQYSWSSR